MRRIYHNKLSISRCYEKRTTRHCAALARKSTRWPGCPTPRLPNLVCSCRLPTLGRTRQGSPWVGLQTPTSLLGISANVVPWSDPTEIRLRTKKLQILKSKILTSKKKKEALLPLPLPFLLCLHWVLVQILAQPREIGVGTVCIDHR